jgi:hypothetical protein
MAYTVRKNINVLPKRQTVLSEKSRTAELSEQQHFKTVLEVITRTGRSMNCLLICVDIFDSSSLHPARNKAGLVHALLCELSSLSPSQIDCLPVLAQANHRPTMKIHTVILVMLVGITCYVPMQISIAPYKLQSGRYYNHTSIFKVRDTSCTAQNGASYTCIFELFVTNI